MGKYKFYWEKNGEKYNFHKDVQYVVYFHGCFCPPHIGHFNEVDNVIKYPNVRVVLNQGGRNRHGVPKHTNYKIWEYYISKCFTEDEISRIDHIQYNSNNTTDKILVSHPWIQSADILIVLRGDEYSNQYKEEISILDYWRSRIYKLYIPIHFLYTVRDHSVISASVLIKHILLYQRGKIKKHELYRYFPQRLSDKQKREMIRLIAKYDVF
jgi:hypothetical protein